MSEATLGRRTRSHQTSEERIVSASVLQKTEETPVRSRHGARTTSRRAGWPRGAHTRLGAGTGERAVSGGRTGRQQPRRVTAAYLEEAKSDSYVYSR